MLTTGRIDPPKKYQELSPGNNIALQTTFWDEVTTPKGFNLSIDRFSFTNAHRFASPTDLMTPGDFAAASDTFRVLNYVHGIKLGPVENHYGVPVLIELGNINKHPAAIVPRTEDDGTAEFPAWIGDNDIVAHTLNFGNLRIPKPNPLFWEVGQDVPVATYSYSYTDGLSGLTGTMGYVAQLMTDGPTDNPEADPLLNVTVGPRIKGLRITTGDRTTPPTGGYNAPSVLPALQTSSTAPTDATIAKDSTKYIVAVDPDNSGWVGTMPEARTASLYPYDSNSQPKVWLIWENPEEEDYSGHIFEFFGADGTGAVDTPDEVPPLYKIHMGKGQTKFPIPDVWLNTLGAEDSVVIRVRTVKYGDGPTLVDMDETPYIQALPATWTDVITSRIDFGPALDDATLNAKFLKAEWRTGVSTITFSPAAVTFGWPGLGAIGKPLFVDGKGDYLDIVIGTKYSGGFASDNDPLDNDPLVPGDVTFGGTAWSISSTQPTITAITGVTAVTLAGADPGAYTLAFTGALPATTTSFYLISGTPTYDGDAGGTTDPTVINVTLQEILNTRTDLIFGNEPTYGQVAAGASAAAITFYDEADAVVTLGNVILNAPFFSGAAVPVGYDLVWSINATLSELADATITDAVLDGGGGGLLPTLKADPDDDFITGDIIAIDVYLQKIGGTPTERSKTVTFLIELT